MEKWIAVVCVATLSGCMCMEKDECSVASEQCLEPAVEVVAVEAMDVPVVVVPEISVVEVAVPAEPQGITLDQYLAKAKVNAVEKGTEYNEKRPTARFNKMDSNGDGIVTREEQVAAFEARQ
jgi:hypothetical protein